MREEGGRNAATLRSLVLYEEFARARARILIGRENYSHKFPTLAPMFDRITSDLVDSDSAVSTVGDNARTCVTYTPKRVSPRPSG